MYRIVDLLDGTADAVTVAVGSGLLAWWAVTDPAVAAGIAVAMVVVLRGLGALLHGLARWIRARALREEAEAQALREEAEAQALPLEDEDTDGT